MIADDLLSICADVEQQELTVSPCQMVLVILVVRNLNKLSFSVSTILLCRLLNVIVIFSVPNPRGLQVWSQKPILALYFIYLYPCITNPYYILLTIFPILSYATCLNLFCIFCSSHQLEKLRLKHIPSC